MRTPTERVTRNAERYLDEDVVLALRVEWGPEAIASRKTLRSGYWARAFMWTPIVLPVLALFRIPQTRKLHEDPSAGSGILALTIDERRILLTTSMPMGKTPTGVLEPLPQGAPLQIDVDLWETDMVPSLTVGERTFVVNGIDFRALMTAVEELEVKAPEIKAVLPRLKAVGRALYGRELTGSS